MVKEEERSRPRTEAGDTGLIGVPEETNVAHKGVEERYISTTGYGAEPATLSKCGERTAKDKAEDPIASTESKVQRFRAVGYGQEREKEGRFYAFPHTCSRDDGSRARAPT